MPGTGASSSKRWCTSFPSPTHLYFFSSPLFFFFGFADAFPSGADTPEPACVFGGVWELGQSPEQTFLCLSVLFLDGEGKPLPSKPCQPLLVLCVPRTGCLHLPAQRGTLPSTQVLPTASGGRRDFESDRTSRDLPGGLGLCHGFPLGWKLLGAGPALVGNS